MDIIGAYKIKIPVAGTASAEANVTPMLKVPLSSIERNFGIIIESILNANTEPKLPAKANNEKRYISVLLISVNSDLKFKLNSGLK